MQQGHFWGTPAKSVIKSLAPGATPIPPPTFSLWVTSSLKLEHLIWSPNLVWLIISVAIYIVFPYDLDPQTSAARDGPITAKYFSERLPLWMCIVMGYFSFWHVTTCLTGWCTRSIIPNRPYRITKVLHNVFYCLCGVVMYVGFENTFVHLWVSGRLPYMSDMESLSSVRNVAVVTLGLCLIPLWRDGHFYFAHRLLHFRPMYKFVHSLHHRNTDVEVFSGLCMHPVEHLYYFACILPNLVLYCSPLIFMFNGVHFMLAPAASHSGYEDHWQADAFHYFHHRYFECNYAGLGCSFLDSWFGSFCGTLREKPPLAFREDTKSTINVFASPPTVEQCIYMAVSMSCVATWVGASAGYGPGKDLPSMVLGCLIGVGPVAAAVIMCVASEGLQSLVAPFAKRPWWETVLHVVVGTMFTSYPIAVACSLSLEKV